VSNDWLFWDEMGNEIFGPVVKNARVRIAAFPPGERWAEEVQRIVAAHNSALQESRRAAIEEAAVKAWSTGMDEYGPYSTFMDPRHVGSRCATAIRSLLAAKEE
jgi:hypothetical protein